MTPHTSVAQVLSKHFVIHGHIHGAFSLIRPRPSSFFFSFLPFFVYFLHNELFLELGNPIVMASLRYSAAEKSEGTLNASHSFTKLVVPPLIPQEEEKFAGRSIFAALIPEFCRSAHAYHVNRGRGEALARGDSPALASSENGSFTHSSIILRFITYAVKVIHTHILPFFTQVRSQGTTCHTRIVVIVEILPTSDLTLHSSVGRKGRPICDKGLGLEITKGFPIGAVGGVSATWPFSSFILRMGSQWETLFAKGSKKIGTLRRLQRQFDCVHS